MNNILIKFNWNITLQGAVILTNTVRFDKSAIFCTSTLQQSLADKTNVYSYNNTDQTFVCVTLFEKGLMNVK